MIAALIAALCLVCLLLACRHSRLRHEVESLTDETQERLADLRKRVRILDDEYARTIRTQLSKEANGS